VRLLEADSGTAAEHACHLAVAHGAVALVAVGGDGTVHRVLQAVAGRATGFGLVAAGTGNDFASAVGVPEDPREAAAGIAAALAAGRDQRIDAALVADAAGRERWFCAVLAAGFDALVNERANRMRWPSGPRRYDLAIVLELARLRARGYTLELDGEVRTVAAEIVAVGNAASYGGGMRILPDADPADGLLDVIYASPLGRAGLTRLKPRLRSGTHVTDPRVTVFRARHVRLRSEGIVAYADGERLGPLDLDLTCAPGAVRLLR